MASRSNAARRLAYILSDEFYGPKLAKLRGEDERRVLDLIDQNRGKEARKAIVDADEKRRERERRRIRGTVRERKEDAAVKNIMRKFGARAKEPSVRRRAGYMTDDELDFAADASYDDLVDRARERPYVTPTVGPDINPFWYH